MKTFVSAALFAAVALAAPAHAQSAPDAAMQAALSRDIRAKDSARDQYRHPAETLAFFQVKPGMVVADYMPSAGWYTRVLVSYLGKDGTYIGLNPDVSKSSPDWQKRLGDAPGTIAKLIDGWHGPSDARAIGVNVGAIPADLNGTVDRVLMFREFHNQLRFGWLDSDMAAIHALLKPDGLVGVVEHRAKPDAPASYTDGNKGYMQERDVIAAFAKAGFELVAKSEINANPKDPANWPNGVWMLPPSLGGATDETRPKLLEIGESDRMTLLFRKKH